MWWLQKIYMGIYIKIKCDSCSRWCIIYLTWDRSSNLNMLSLNLYRYASILYRVF